MNTGTLSGMKSGVGGFRVGSPRSAVNTGTGRVHAAEGRFGCVPHNQQLGGGGGAMTSRPTNALSGHPGIAFFPGDFGAMVAAGNGNFLITNGNSPYSSFFHTGGRWFFDGGGGGGTGTFESNSWFQNVPDVDSGIGICGQFVSGNILQADHGTVTVSDWHDFWSTTGFVTDPTTTRPGVITMTNRANYFAEMGRYNVGMTLTTEAALRIIDNLGVANGAVVTTRVGVDIPLLAQPTGGCNVYGIRSLTPSLLYGLSTRKAGNTSDLFTFGDLFGAPFMNNTDGIGGQLGSMAVSSTFGYLFTHAIGLAIQDFGDTGPRVTLGHIGGAASVIGGDGAGATYGVMTIGSAGFSFSVASTFTQGIVISGSKNIALATSGGTMLGVASNQLLAFWGATPTAQISGSTDILAGMVTTGLRGASSNPPLNMGTGLLTAGSISMWATDTTFTSLPAWVGWANTYTLNFASAGAGTFLNVSPTIIFQQSGTTFGSFIGHTVAPVLKNLSSVAANFGTVIAYNSSATITADTQTGLTGSLTEYNANPSTSVASGGTMTLSAMTAFSSGLTVGAGTTVSARTGLVISNATGAGTLTTQIGIDIASLTKGGTNIGIRCKSVVQFGSSAQWTVDASGNMATSGTAATGALTVTGLATVSTTLTVTGNVGFNGKAAQATTGWSAPTATALRSAAPNATYSTTGGTGITAGAFDSSTHRDNVITDLANTMQRLGALVTDLRANGVIG